MHPNPIYRTAPSDRNLAFGRERAFGVLAVNGAEGPLISHVPFLLSDDGATAELHLVRSNPIARALTDPSPAAIAVTGPDSYISPDWYGMDDQVPTWNYVAVHLRGTLELRLVDELEDLLDRQSAEYEGRLLPKHPWTMAKMSAEGKARFLRMILPFRLTVTGVDGTWKFSQNKPDTARLSAADGAAEAGFGAETDALARMMRDA